MRERIRQLSEELARVTDPEARLEVLVDAAAGVVGVDGVTLSLFADEQVRHPLHWSDPRAREVDELQFRLGEGPCFEAFRSGRPVLEPDLAGSSSWPVYATEVRALGVEAVFAFPLGFGAARLGAVSMLRERAEPLDADELASALFVAEACSLSLVDVLNEVPPIPAPSSPGSADRALVHQATGMIAVQLGIGIADAFSTLRARAWHDGRTLEDVAEDVVRRRLRFER